MYFLIKKSNSPQYIHNYGGRTSTEITGELVMDEHLRYQYSGQDEEECWQSGSGVAVVRPDWRLFECGIFIKSPSNGLFFNFLSTNVAVIS